MMKKSETMDLQDTIRTYRLFSGSYDIVFGPVFHPGRKEAVRIANDRPGQRILEVGVGTGLSLPYFRADSRVTGIDVSEEMLAKARRRAERLPQVEALYVMDAENLEFPDNSFDAVLALYVASVVPSPVRFAAEMRRVCIPGGTIVVVNHFTSTSPILGFLTEALDPVTRYLGWSTKLKMKPFIEEAQLNVDEVYKLSKLSLHTVLVGTNEKNGHG